MRKNIVLSLILFYAAAVGLHADEPLKSIILGGNWARLEQIFLDDSGALLKDNFRDCKALQMSAFKAGHWLYQAKFADRGEIGIIAFEKDRGKYAKLKLLSQIKPLYFIGKFKKYSAENIKLTVGDAEILFKRGIFYESLPYRPLLFFKGEWEFYIKPNSEEERFTLERKFNRDFFSKTNNTGIFLLQQGDFLKELSPAGEVKQLDDDLLPLLRMYRGVYGISVKGFGEYWYQPFPGETNLVVFAGDEQSYYYYSFGRNLHPDTQLSTSGDNQLILSYNARGGLKLKMKDPVGVSRLQMEVNVNPYRNFISGNTLISYREPASLRELRLAKGIVLRDSPAADVNAFRVKEKCFVMASEKKEISLRFSGTVKPGIKDFELFRSLDERQPGAYKEWYFYYLSKSGNYYPNPGDSFFKTHVKVNLPFGLYCLGPGNLTGKKLGEVTTYEYSSPGTKGISLAVGPFKKSKTLKGRIPIHFFTFKGFEYPKRFDLPEIKDALDFFWNSFGPLDLTGINILMKRSRIEGGLSNNGFMVVHMLPTRTKKDFFKSPRLAAGRAVEKKTLPPSLIRERSEDCVLHELAHQWWGGIISGESYQDVWLTEGLAHFSVLYYLKKRLSEKKFHRLIKKTKKWVYRYSDYGPVIYGTRIHLLENDYEAYQGVIYNKSALVLLALMELTGEEDFVRRLRSVLEKYKYQNITSMQFIKQFSGEDEMILNFFKKWMYSRKQPQVALNLLEDDPVYDRVNLKKIALSIEQLGTDFIFPLELKVEVDRGGASVERVIIKQRQQRVVISRETTIRSIDVLDSIALVKEKKAPGGSSQSRKNAGRERR